MSRWGMRRPWILGSSLFVVAGLLVVATARTLPLLLIGWSLTAVACSGLLAGLVAVLPDEVPPDQRGMVSGTLGVGQALAAVVGAGLASALSGSLLLMFLVPGFLTLLTAVMLVTTLRDRRMDPADRPPLGVAGLARSFWVNPRRFPDFGWTWASRFLIFMAVASVLN